MYVYRGNNLWKKKKLIVGKLIIISFSSYVIHVKLNAD